LISILKAVYPAIDVLRVSECLIAVISGSCMVLVERKPAKYAWEGKI
jgi:hypothetical protein